MTKKCKCINPNQCIVVNGIGIKCEKCKKWVTKFRKTFHRNPRIKKSKKLYNRQKEKEKIKEDLDE